MFDKKAFKQRYRRLAKTCKALWNEFDPLGVYDDDMKDKTDAGFGTLDEYSSYVPETVKLVLAGADEDQLRSYVSANWEELIASKAAPSEVDAFAKKLAALVESDAKPCVPR